MYRHLIIAIFAVSLLAGCSARQPTSPAPVETQLPARTSVIEHPRPSPAANTQGFSDVGCEGQLSAASCAELIALGCDVIWPTYQFGGLKPAQAVMSCIHEDVKPANKEYFTQGMCLDRSYHSYVIFQNGKYQLAKEAEFRSVFAPIESADEALSYALAVTEFFPDYDVEISPYNVYLVETIEETHVEEMPAGYLVHLFDSDHRCGCALHPIYAVDVLVTRDGQIQQANRQEIYQQHVCVD